MAKNPFLWWLPESEADAKGKPAKSRAADKPSATKAPAKKAPASKPAPEKPAVAKSALAKAPAGKPAAAKGKAGAGKAEKPPVANQPAAKPAEKTAKRGAKAAPVANQQPAQAAYDTHDKPGLLIRRAQQIAVAIFLEHCGGYDLTPVQYGALAAIAGNPGIDATRIAGIVALDRTTISGVLERLEAKGLIARSANDLDRRAKLLVATAAGKKLIRKIEPAVEAAQDAILAPLNRQERSQLLSLLTKLVDLNNEASRAPRRAVEAA